MTKVQSQPMNEHREIWLEPSCVGKSGEDRETGNGARTMTDQSGTADIDKLEQALHEASVYGIGATSDVNQRVILNAAKQLRASLQPAKCQKCGCKTNGEEALVEGQIWCHPCADDVTATGGDAVAGDVQASRASINETETILDAINDFSPRARQTVDLILYKFDVRARNGVAQGKIDPATVEACAQAAEAQKETFLSPQYASNQPFGSLCERFACDEVVKAIRALAIPSTERK